MGNTAWWSTTDWTADIKAAWDAHIDAFALNVQNGDAANDAQVPNAFNAVDAFNAANNANFKLFFSFDYAGGKPAKWGQQSVTDMINKYSSRSSYFRRGSAPLVSTFEGPESADDWTYIKAHTGCYFMPDWSSRGAQPALKLNPQATDGLFSWAAWPYGADDMNAYVDASYLLFLQQAGNKTYMMPASPWFYTNMPGYGKNWLWRGDHVWFDRWQEIIALSTEYDTPDYVEIISWNDFGESHYIGPLHDNEFIAFSNADGYGKSPFNYATGMPHDGWRQFLPYVIDLYKYGKASIKQESLSVWYRLYPSNGCSDGHTTGNTASQLQVESEPGSILQDQVFFTALLTSEADVTVTVGGNSYHGGWTTKPPGGAGLYHGSAPISGTGPISVSVMGMTAKGSKGYASNCDDNGNFNNYNAYVVSTTGRTVWTDISLDGYKCVAGFGINGFEKLCSFACSHGYCPYGACTCTQVGPPPTMPTPGQGAGYPASGLSDNYGGLCDFACNYGYCPSQYCSHTKQPVVNSPNSPFTPPACTGGTGLKAEFNTLCQYSCQYGYCPMHLCSCSSQGILKPLPKVSEFVARRLTTGPYAGSEDVDNLCGFSCKYGRCDSSICSIGLAGVVDHNPSYYNIPCTDINHQDVTRDPVVRWTGLHCEDAWDDAVAFANKKNGTNGVEWSELMMMFFHMSVNQECAKAMDQCVGAADVCSETNSIAPAFEMIASSMFEIDKVGRLYLAPFGIHD